MSSIPPNPDQYEVPVNQNLVQALSPQYGFRNYQGALNRPYEGAINYFYSLSPEDQAAIYAGLGSTYNVGGGRQISGQAALNRSLNDWYRGAVNAGTVTGLAANSMPTQGHWSSWTPEQRASYEAGRYWTAPTAPQTTGAVPPAAAASGTLNAFNGGNSGGGNVPGAQPVPGVSTTSTTQPTQPAQPPAQQPYDYKAAQERQKQQQAQRAQYAVNKPNPY